MLYRFRVLRGKKIKILLLRVFIFDHSLRLVLEFFTIFQVTPRH
jgi:hypothetical protein